MQYSKLGIFCLLALFLCVGTTNADTRSARSTVERFNATLFKIMQNASTLRFSGRYASLEPVLLDSFDIQFMAQFSEAEQKKLSKPYNVSSKLGKFIWGNPYESVSTNRKNLISVIKTYPKKELDNFLEKIIVMAVADRDLDNRESQYLIASPPSPPAPYIAPEELTSTVKTVPEFQPVPVLTAQLLILPVEEPISETDENLEE